MKLRFLMFLALMVPAVSSASDWYYFTETQFGDMHYIDVSSITTQANGTKRAWFSSVEINEGSSKRLWSFRCGTRESDVISLNDYDKDGRVSKTEDYPHRNYSPVVPDSIGETMLEIVCSKTPKTYLKIIGEQTSLAPEVHAKRERAKKIQWDDEPTAKADVNLVPFPEGAPLDLPSSIEHENTPFFDADSARKSGYSDKEIADHIGRIVFFNVEAARIAGKSDADIVNFLVKRGMTEEERKFFGWERSHNGQ